MIAGFFSLKERTIRENHVSVASAIPDRNNAQQGREKFSPPSRPRSASPLPLRRAPVCAVLLRCLGGFGGVLGGVEAAYIQVMERLAKGL